MNLRMAQPRCHLRNVLVVLNWNLKFLLSLDEGTGGNATDSQESSVIEIAKAMKYVLEILTFQWEN